jgi:hypothetical protein
MKQRLFLTLSLHAKMHKQLDQLNLQQQLVERIEKAEIKAFDNETEYNRLEQMKKELLSIRFA